jgi:hypothetical protein
MSTRTAAPPPQTTAGTRKPVQERLDRLLSSRLVTSRWVWLLVAQAVLLFSLWPAFRIRFSIIDDHEIVDMIGRRDRIPLQDVISTTIERSNEPLGRFRPVYWLLRTLEGAIAGQNSTWWYVDRFALAAITLAAVFAAIVVFVRPPLAALLSLLPFIGVQAETWYRLGPNEAYAMPFLAIGVAGVVRAAQHDLRPARQWWCYGFLVAAGLAKENFIPIAVVIVAWSGLHHGIRRWRTADWCVLGAAALLVVLDLLALKHKLDAFGDVYSQDRSFAATNGWYGAAVATMDQHHRFTAAVVAAVLLCLVLSSRPPRRVLVGTGIAVAVAFASQAYFYAGGPQSARYFYPVVLVAVLAWALAVYQLLGQGNRRIGLVGGLVVALALAGPVVDGIALSRSTAATSAEVTSAFQADLAAMVDQIEATDKRVIVLQPWEPATEIEPTLSMARYLSTRSDLTVMAVPSSGEQTGFSLALNQQLRKWSRDGFSALTPYDKPDPTSCISIIWGQAKPICADYISPI